MPEPDAGTIPLSQVGLRRVDLPFQDKYIFQDPLCQPVTDASALLQDYIASSFPETPITALELGSGCGIVSIMLALRRPLWQITGLDIQDSEVLLSQANARLCSVPVSFIRADLRAYSPDVRFPLIYSNPPWQPLGSGRSSPILSRRTGREELTCTMRDVLMAFERLLCPAGQGVLIYPIAREEEFKALLTKSSLDIIELLRTNGSKKYFICRIKQRGNHDC